MDDYRMLAEHFGKSDRVRVVISGSEAKTDGETIWLPENVPAEIQSTLLATLLHEAYHIRYSDFKEGQKAQAAGGDHRFHVLNVLEDIRIDHKILGDWPNAKNLYFDLDEYIHDVHGEKFAALPWQVQVLRRVIFESYGDPDLFSPFYPKGSEVETWFEKHGDFAKDVIARAKKAKDTQALEPLIDEILHRLFPGDEARKKEREELEQERQGQSGKGGQARGEQREAQGQGQEAYDKLAKLDEDARENEKEAHRERAQGKQKDQDAEAAEKQGKKAEAARAKSEAKDHNDKAEEHEKKADALNKQAKPLDQKLQDLKKNFEAAKKAAEKAEKAAAQAEAAQGKMDQEDAQAQADGLKGLNEIGVGFDKIQAQDLIVRKLVPENIEDEVLEFLRCREDRKIHAREGKIDPRRLPTFYNPDNLFEYSLNDGKYKTRVHFLVDVSGSMGDKLSGEDVRKSAMATEAVINISKAIEKGIGEGLDIDYGIFGFDNEAHEVKLFDQPLVEQAVKNGLVPRGGTDPRRVIENIEEKNQPDNVRTKQVVFMITDGEFGSDAYTYLEQRLGGHIKWIFLGIDADSGYDKRCKDLFGKYNVGRAKDLKNALGRALIDNMD